MATGSQMRARLEIARMENFYLKKVSSFVGSIRFMEAIVTQSVKNEVLRYIQSHLGSDLSLDELARRSGYSPFHLHRILKEELDQPLGAYIKRRRIEAGALLLALTRLPVSNIADWIGYSSGAAFAKAFDQVMHCSPRTFRKKNPFDAVHPKTAGHYFSLDYRIVRVDAWQGLAFPSVCNYFDRSLFTCWDPVKDYLRKAELQKQTLDYWGVLYECPNVSGNPNARIDAVIKAPQGLGTNELFNAHYGGGKFAVFRFCAPHSMIREITLNISAYILHETSLDFRYGNSYVHYLNSPIDHDPDYLTTEWYIPIQ